MKSNQEIVIGGISSKELLIFAKQLHASLRAGFNLAQAVEVALAQSKGRLKQVLTKVHSDIKHGAYLHEALTKHKKYFPPLFINLIKTGELSGSLKENSRRLVFIVEKEISFRQKIRGAMVYPSFILVAVVALGLSVAIFVLPNLLPLFSSLDIELPFSTRVLIWFAELFDAHGLAIFFGFIAFVIASLVLITRPFSKPFVHWLSLRIPLIGTILRQLTMARFGRALASLLRSGVPIDQSLMVIKGILTNYYYQKVVASVLPKLEKGGKLSDSLAVHGFFFDPIFVQLLALGETTAGLEEACDNVAEYFESEVDERMRNLAISIEPILIILVGAVVAFVAFSILGPIYKITGNIR